MWDYNIDASECLDLIEGRTDHAGHYTREQLIKKILESFPWFVVTDLIPICDLYPFLTDKFLTSLRSEHLQKRYAFLRERLQKNL